MARAVGHRLLLVFSAVMAVLVANVGTARAGESARLAYVRGEGAEQCADEKGLRLAVAVRLGYDPFVAWAPKTVHADVARAAGRLRARVYLAGEDGRAEGSRELFANVNECDKLLAAVALAISIAVDPMSLGTPPVDVDRAPPTDGAARAGNAGNAGTDDRHRAAPDSTVPATPISAARSPVTPERDDVASPEPRALASRTALQWTAGLGSVVATGTAPDLAVGLALYARLGIDVASLAVEGRYQLPASHASTTGRGAVEARLYLVSIEPCFRLTPMSLCGLATVGWLDAKGEGVTTPLEEQTIYWAAGVRAAIEVPVWAPIAARGHVDLVGNGTRTALLLDRVEAWRAPVLALAAGVDALVRFW